jgi:hypothetical protein
MAKKGPTDTSLRQYALELMNQKNGETITAICQRVFEYTEGYAKTRAFELKKHPVVLEELGRIQKERESHNPASKEDKLLKNKILLDEAYAERDVESYIKLARIDNDMQGHTKSAETEDEKVKGGNMLIATLMSQLREKNKGIKSAQSQEIIDIS